MKVVNTVGAVLLEYGRRDNRVYVTLGMRKPVNGGDLGYSRLFFRAGRGWAANFKHLTPTTHLPYMIPPFRLVIPFKPCVGLIRNNPFTGAICGPAIRLNTERALDIWAMLLAPSTSRPSITLSKHMLSVVESDAAVTSTLGDRDGVLSCSLSAHGEGFRRASLYIERIIDTGFSMTFGSEKISLKEEIGSAEPGEMVDAEWVPVSGPGEPVVFIARSMPSYKAVAELIQLFGYTVKRRALQGPGIVETNHLIIGDGEHAKYRIALTVEKTMRTLKDEAEMKIAWKT